mgnify:CR=1 FL=1
MQRFIGTKLINAVAMNRQDYNELRGWELPADEDGSDKGFLVEYVDGGEPNVDGYEGYVSWSPDEVFNNAYRSVEGLSFGLAIEAMKKGLKVARKGWNGKGMWLILVPGSPSIKPAAGTPYSNAGITEPTNINPHIDMFTATGEMQPGWLASQTDMLADDWGIV